MAVSVLPQYTLRPKDIQKASEIFGVDEATLIQMNDRMLLNTDFIRSVLIKADFERLTSGLHWLENNDKKYNYPEVQKALQREYNIESKVLQQILYGKNTKIVFCKKCGVRISKKTYERTDGLCSNCFAETLDL